jgi:hypothetical protein
VNTESWEVIYKICGEPIFVKSKNGEVRLLDAEGTVGNSRLEPGDISWVYDGSVERIRERFNSEKNNSLKKEDIASHYENCSSENKGQIADPFIVFNKTNVVSNFIVSWPSVLGDLSLNINLTDFNVKINNIKITPTTSLGKIPENIEIPCFWGYLYNTNHLCFRRTATGSSWCAKDLNHDKTYVSSDNRYFLPIYCYDNASSPSGWQIRQSIGVFDSLNKKWIALPEIEPPWGGNIRTTRFSGEDMPSSPVDIPICLPKAISPPNDLYRHHYYSPTTKILWISSSNDGLIKINLDTSVMEARYTGITPFQVFCAEDNLILGIPRVDTPRLELWKQSPLQKIADFFVASDGNIIAVCDNSYYATPHGNSHMVGFRIGNKGSPLEQYDLRLNRPDIVLERLGSPKEAIETAKFLREKRLKRMGVTEEMLKPDFHLPELQIVGEVPATTPKDQLDLQIKATDDKYPLDRLRVYVNNVPVNGRDGELLRDQKTQSLEKTIPIKLAAGRNKIQVSVLNSAGAESLYANAEVHCTAERPKPKLYAVALGVSQYDRPEWCLKYAAKDATDLIAKLKEKAASSYSEVKPLLLTDKEVTKDSTAKIKEFLSGATIDDTVLIFMAGHGLLDDKYDYYFGTTDIDPAKPSERGMPYEAIDNILAEVPSLKKALLMDTCHAGELDDDEKKELAASDGTATPSASPDAINNTVPALAGKVAMRAIGTRGMQVKAVEGAKGKSDWYEKLQDMFVDLRRGSGATVISSSQGAEYAFESSEQSNGLFTYSLMEALDGKATPNKDGQITINSIGDYVKKRVQDLTKVKQNPNLRGVNLEEDFALGAAK